MHGGTSKLPARAMAVALAMAGLGLAACQGPDIEADPARRIPARVLVRPVPSDRLTPVDPALVAREVADGLRNAMVFSEVSAPAGSGAEAGEEKGAPPDYICAIEVKGTNFRPEISSATNQAFLSSFLWFLAIFPAWWIDDRTYNGSDVEIHARFFRAGGGKADRALLDLVIPTNQLELDLIRRGATWQFFLSIILPPFWMESTEKAGASLPLAAAAKARMGVAERARREWPRAALMADPGCFLILDPPTPTSDEPPAPGRRASLGGWILARAPLFDLQVLDGSREVKRFDRVGVQKLSVPLTGTGEETLRARKAIGERLGEETPLLRAAYRLDLNDLPAGSSGRIRLAARLGPDAQPATFTIPGPPSD